MVPGPRRESRSLPTPGGPAPRERSGLRAVVVALVAAIVLVAFGAFQAAIMAAPHGIHNEGASGLGANFQHAVGPDGVVLTYDDRPVRIVHDRVLALDPEREALLVVAPGTAYSDAAVDAIDDFLVAGGRALIADDTGSGRNLVLRLGLGVEITQAQVYSTSHRSDPLRPLAEDTGVLPGFPALVELPGTNAVRGEGEVVLRAHPLSWLDLNADGKPSLGEPQAAFALALRVPHGAGELVILAAPDLLVPGATQDHTGAAQARTAFLTWLSTDRVLVVHEAHRAAADPLGLGAVLAGDAPTLQAGLLLAAAGLAVLAVAGLRLIRVRPRRPTPIPDLSPAARNALVELPLR